MTSVPLESPQEQTLPADLNEEAIAQLILSSDIAALETAANALIGEKRNREAASIVKRVIELNGKDVNARFAYAMLLGADSHAKLAESRDVLLHPARL